MSKILIIAEHPEVGKILDHYLSSHGFIVQVAHTLKEAHKLMEEVIFNLSMIDLSSFKQKEFEDFKIPKLFMCDIPDEGNFLIGAIKNVDYIFKPFKEDELTNKMNTLLGRSYHELQGAC